MPSKHQIGSSNSKTQRKAKRCWRRQYKQVNLAGLSNADATQVKKSQETDMEKLKFQEGDVERRATGKKGKFGTNVGELLKEIQVQEDPVVAEMLKNLP